MKFGNGKTNRKCAHLMRRALVVVPDKPESAEFDEEILSDICIVQTAPSCLDNQWESETRRAWLSTASIRMKASSKCTCVGPAAFRFTRDVHYCL